MTEAKHTPGPWFVGYNGLDVGCINAKIGGHAKLFDIRGWGYLTGGGHGALGLSNDDAVRIQSANANLIAAAPDLLEALYRLMRECEMEGLESRAGFDCWIGNARAAIAKANGNTK